MTASVADSSPLTLPHVVVQHALTDPTRIALTFLVDGEQTAIQLSYGALVARASAIAHELKRRDLAGRPVVVLYPAGPSYLCALLGCFWAGAIAVPAYPPTARSLSRAGERIAGLVADAGAVAALTSEGLLGLLSDAPELDKLTKLATDAWCARGHEDAPLSAADLEPIALDIDQPCLLQYTSGSTSTPKGVLLTHGQTVANLEIIFGALGPEADGPMATWLPPYHDMGLIGTLLFPLHRGNRIVQLAPEAFIRRPIRWLRAISEERAVATATPNFALELCIRRISPEQRAGLDLSCLRFMFNGSEPIDAASLEAFSEAYAPHGLRPEALAPCYGMAEATLLLSVAAGRNASRIRAYSAATLAHGRADAPGEDERARRLVSCGPAQPEGSIRIVDPQRCVELGEREVGEIWAMSPSIASGYWHRPEETRATFHARLRDSGEGPFLRTGDLGFLDHGELFVTGRLKDSIIVRGKKHYPQDIERTVQRLDPALSVDAGAAFAIEIDGGERVCLVQELDHRARPNLPALLEAIPRAILEQHELALHAVVLVKRGTLLKTSSGKIKRCAMRQAFLDDDLVSVARWQAQTQPLMAAATAEPAMAPERDESPERETRTRLVTGERRCAAIERFLRDKLAALAKLQPSQIDLDAPVAQYGVDSLAATELAEALEAWLGQAVPATISYDHPTTRGIAHALAGLPAADGGATARSDHALHPTARAHPQPNGAPIAIVGMACR
ncbi:MAG TPA: AMP-binding protein, partial [Polyangiales bacterium]|nr:AMP-binding protein [Polyangiales bacterium]